MRLAPQEISSRREHLRKLAELQIYELVKAHLREPFEHVSVASEGGRESGNEKVSEVLGTSVSDWLQKILANLIVTVENIHIRIQGADRI